MLETPTIPDLLAMKQGLWFDETTAPTLERAEQILANSTSKAFGVFKTIGLTQEQVDEMDPISTPELQEWFLSYALYDAMAEVWQISPAATKSNPYRERADQLRAQMMNQFQRFGIVTPEGELLAGRPSSVPVDERQFGGQFDNYVRRATGF